MINYGLVLGTVDSPSLHDFVLDFVIEGHTAPQLQTAHAMVVELFRSRRPPVRGGWSHSACAVAPAAAYVTNELGHHIRNAMLGRSDSDVEILVEPWLTDAVAPLDAITLSIARILGKDVLR